MNAVRMSVLAGLMWLAGTGLLSAACPFGDAPVAVSPSTATVAGDAEAKSGKKPGLWDRLIGTAKKGYGRVTTGINNAVTSHKPPAFVTTAAPIPGYDGKEFVCQGVCPLPEAVQPTGSASSIPVSDKRTVLSYYPDEQHTKAPSQLVVVDTATGKPLRRFSLFAAAGDPYTGHAGGIAIAGKYVWVASGFKLYGFLLDDVLAFINNNAAQADPTAAGFPPSLRIPARDLVAATVFAVDSKASCLSFDGTHLWVGDFARAGSDDFAPIPHHAKNKYKRNTWISGYLVDGDGLPTASVTYAYEADGATRLGHKPDRVILCRESVQGMAICDNHIALSLSFGALNAKLAFYRSPLTTPPTTLRYTPAGQKKSFAVDAWELADGKNWVKTVDLPAGSEDLEFDGRRLYVVFESGAPKYHTKWIGMNPLITTSDHYYLIDPLKALR